MLFSKRASKDQKLASSTSGGYLYHVLKTFESRNPGSEIVIQRGRNADVVEYVLMSAEQQPIMKAARFYGFRNIQNLVRKLKPARVSRLPGAKASVGAAGGNRRQPMSRNGASAGPGPDYAYVEVMACPGGCTNGGGQIRIEDAKQINSNMQTATPGDAPEISSKPTPHEQRAWLARVDEAYYSADSDSESIADDQQSSSLAEKESRIHDAMRYWSQMMGVPLSKLVQTTYREVQSDVGKTQNGGNDTARVVELAGKIGGGW